MSKALARTLTSLASSAGKEVKIAFRTVKTGSIFSSKSRTTLLYRSSVVYSFNCQIESDTSYIGRTTRHLTTRIGEHRSNPSAIRTHLNNCQSCTENLDDNFKIIDYARDNFELSIKEALHIRHLAPSLNRALKNQGASVHLRLFR